MGRLDGKIAVVTGGTQGLGAEVARLSAERGAKGLVIWGRSREKGEAKAYEITDRYGIPVHFIAADLGMVSDCRRVIAAADEKFGRIDALVNVAAITDRGTILDTDEALFDRISCGRSLSYMTSSIITLMSLLKSCRGRAQEP